MMLSGPPGFVARRAWSVVIAAIVILSWAQFFYAIWVIKMSQALSDLTASVTALEAHAAAVNAERANLFAELQAAKAAPVVAPPTDDTELAALKVRVDAVAASIVAPVATVAAPAVVEAPAPVVTPAS